VIVFVALAFFFAADFIEHPQRVEAAACPFIDGGTWDDDATTDGTITVSSSRSVASSATAYDCTGVIFHVTGTGNITLQGGTATGYIAEMSFTTLTIDSGGKIQADGQGCPGVAKYEGYGPNSSNVCTYQTAGYGLMNSGGAGHGGAGGQSSTHPNTGGVTYGSATAPVLFGSSGSSIYYSYPHETIVSGAGGGVVRLSVSGTLTNNGTISADGGNGITSGIGPGGGGSGGSVYITATTVNGTTGVFRADGGDGDDGLSADGGGGGGGRIAIIMDLGNFNYSSSSLTVSGGTGPGSAIDGSAGTVFVNDNNGTTGDTTDDYVSIYHGFTYTDTDYSVNHWTFDPGADNQYCDRTISSGATPSITDTMGVLFDGTFNCGQTIASFGLYGSSQVMMDDNSSINVTGVVNLVSSAGSVFIDDNASVTSSGGMTLTAGSTFDIEAGVTLTNNGINSDITFNVQAGDSQTWSGVTVNNAAEGEIIMDDAVSLTLTGNTAINSSAYFPNLTALTVDSGSSINANSKGCRSDASGDGYGPNGSNVCSQSTAGWGDGYNLLGYGPQGAGHGGMGGLGTTSNLNLGGATYDTPTAPVLFGSAGGSTGSNTGGYGGGLIRITVFGTFTHNGSFSASGGAGSASTGGGGGGSGGSINISAPTVDGTTGTFTADGGAGGNGSSQDGGGGGGGRVAIVMNSGSFGFSSSNLSAVGGLGPDSAADGGKGTVFVRDNQGNGDESDDAVSIYHGFTYTDYDWSVASWAFDSSATNQYCDAAISSGATPSVTASSAMTFRGSFTCGRTITSMTFQSPAGLFTASGSALSTASGGALNLSSSAGPLAIGSSSALTTAGAMTLTAGTTFDIDTGTTLTNNTLNSDITFNVQAGDSQTWSGLTINNAAEGEIIMDDAVSLTLTGNTAINSSAYFPNLTALTIDSGSSINANSKGCRAVSTSDGYGPNGSNVCAINTAGWGDGYNIGYGVQGAGHGGTGGLGTHTSLNGGGATYGSSTSPVLFGSGGGSSGTSLGGYGGGLIRITVSGTFTHNGTVSAEGGVGVGAGGGGAGGGSGGSINIILSTISGTTGTISADGGSGGDGTSANGGGGGGGRIAISYETDSSSFLSGLTAAGVATGGAGPDDAADGVVGTLYLNNTNPAPVVTSVTHLPASPFTDTPVTVSASATDNAGVTKIEIYLDGTAPGNLKGTCNFDPATSPASCDNVAVGMLSRGSHTAYAKAYDAAAQTDTDSEAFSVAGYTTSNTLKLSRLAKSATDVDFTLTFTLAGESTGTLTVTFPGGFTVTQAGSVAGGSSACLSSFGYTSSTLTATKTACNGAVTLAGAKLTNPSTAGEYAITWTNDNGSGVVYINDVDQVMVTAQVDPIMVFDIDTNADCTAADGSGDNDIAFGALTPGTAATASERICLRLDTNASGGAVVQVRSANEGLYSAATGHTIGSTYGATYDLSTSIENYGICISSLNKAAGTPGTLNKGTYYDQSCSTPVVGGVDVDAFQLLLDTNSDPIDGDGYNTADIRVSAKALPTTPAASDYEDTLTFRATATF
jgi:hypothetical protein